MFLFKIHSKLKFCRLINGGSPGDPRGPYGDPPDLTGKNIKIIVRESPMESQSLQTRMEDP